MMAAGNVRGIRLVRIQEALRHHGITYDFNQNDNGDVGIRWHHRGKSYSVFQPKDYAGKLSTSHNITTLTGVSQAYVCNFIDRMTSGED